MVKVKLDREGELRYKKKQLAIILKSTKGAKFKWIKDKSDHFIIDKNYYFLDESGTYISKKGVRFSVYLEGIATPLTHQNIEREEITKQIFDPQVQEQVKVKFTKIKGLQFDSKLIHLLLNTKIAEQFRKHQHDAFGIMGIILLFALLGIGIASLVMWFI